MTETSKMTAEEYASFTGAMSYPAGQKPPEMGSSFDPNPVKTIADQIKDERADRMPKDCPWCGSKVGMFSTPYYAECNNRTCLASGPVRENRDEAIDAWDQTEWRGTLPVGLLDEKSKWLDARDESFGERIAAGEPTFKRADGSGTVPPFRPGDIVKGIGNTYHWPMSVVVTLPDGRVMCAWTRVGDAPNTASLDPKDLVLVEAKL